MITKRKPRSSAFTLVEGMVVILLISLVTIPMLVTFQFVMRTQATAANQSLVRLRSNTVIDQLVGDIQNTSRGRYNATSVGRLSIFGTGPAANSFNLQLLDTVIGQRITWAYAAETGRLTRTAESYATSSTAVFTTTEYDQRFQDLRIEETLRTDFDTTTVTGAVDNETITGLRLWGRVFLTMNPYHTTFQEVDGDGDGDYRNDVVGEELFDRTDEGDDPRWQYIFNVSATFRNT